MPFIPNILMFPTVLHDLQYICQAQKSTHISTIYSSSSIQFLLLFSDVALILKPWVRFLCYISLSLQFRTVPQTCFDISSLEIVLEIILSYCTLTLKLGFLHVLIQVIGRNITEVMLPVLSILAGDVIPTCPLLVMWLLPDNVSTVKRLFPLGDQQVLSGKVL